MAELGSIAHQFSQALSSMRSSLEIGQQRYTGNDLPTDELSSIAGRLESIRFKLGTSYRPFPPSELKEDTFRIAMAIMNDDLSSLLNSPSFSSLSKMFKLRTQLPARNSMRIFERFTPKFSESTSVYEAAIILRDLSDRFASNGFELPVEVLEEVSTSQEPVADATAIASLKRIVPEQKLAPVQFDISNNKVVIRNKSSSSLEDDKSNISSARESIVKNGESIIDSLRSSNCDKRLLESVQSLHDQIIKNSNAVQIGISNIACGMVSDQFQGELPDALVGMLKAHTISIGMYVAQFPDWSRFSENAASAEIDESDIEEVDRAARSIIDYIENNKEIAEPNVLKAFKQLHSVIRSPRKNLKRSVFAVIRTIENLASKLFQFAISYFEQTAKQTKDDLAKVTSKVIVGAMVAFAIAGTSNLLGLTSKVNELAWLNTAIEIVQKQMQNIK